MEPYTPTLLIVDDENANIALLTRIFQHDYHVVVAKSGQEALERVESESPDVVLLDVMLPDLNGLKVLESIRARPDWSDLPVILVSALQQNSDIALGLQHGANDYITKPFDADIVIARVGTQAKLKHLTDERKEAINHLRDANTVKERFMRIASHDLKNPLSNLQMVCDLLHEQYQGDEQIKPMLDIADASVSLMLDIINQFLEAAVVRDGELELILVPIHLADALPPIVQQYRVHANSKDITLHIQSTEGTIIADPNRLLQIVGNLVSNAVKYSPPGTTVTIWTDILPDKVRVNVQDQGPGIPPDEKDDLFQPFGKLTPRPTAGETSIGLGLWIVKHLVELQGGQVGVDSPEEGGARFWVTMPTSTDESHQLETVETQIVKS